MESSNERTDREKLCVIREYHPTEDAKAVEQLLALADAGDLAKRYPVRWVLDEEGDLKMAILGSESRKVSILVAPFGVQSALQGGALEILLKSGLLFRPRQPKSAP
jgi:hypothetical protein